jgi:hypothetical protein
MKSTVKSLQTQALPRILSPPHPKEMLNKLELVPQLPRRLNLKAQVNLN